MNTWKGETGPKILGCVSDSLEHADCDWRPDACAAAAWLCTVFPMPTATGAPTLALRLSFSLVEHGCAPTLRVLVCVLTIIHCGN